MVRRYLLAVAIAIGVGCPAVWAQKTIAITGARLLTVTQGTIENGTVLVENGKIAAVGKNVRIPAGAQVIDARGKVVMPGMIDAGNRLGLVEIPGERVTVDSTEYTDPLHPELRVLDALNTSSELIRVTRAEGITNALSTPAEGNLIAGQSAFINLDGETAAEMVVKSPAALHLNLGEASKETYGRQGKAPGSRMGEMAMLRQAFLQARHYREEQEAFAKRQDAMKSGAEAAKPSAPPARDLKLEVLLEALDGKLPVVVTARRLSDIDNALRLAEEFNLKLVVSGASSAWRLADKLAAKKVSVIVGPIQEVPERAEAVDVRLDNAAQLARAGVTIAIQTNVDNDTRELPFAVEYAIGYGLPEETALAAVTINPARMFGVDDRLGSLEAGKQANLIVLDGMPFHVKTHVTTVLINGKVVDLSNHQTQLFEVYKRKYGIQ